MGGFAMVHGLLQSEMSQGMVMRSQKLSWLMKEAKAVTVPPWTHPFVEAPLVVMVVSAAVAAVAGVAVGVLAVAQDTDRREGWLGLIPWVAQASTNCIDIVGLPTCMLDVQGEVQGMVLGGTGKRQHQKVTWDAVCPVWDAVAPRPNHGTAGSPGGILHHSLRHPFAQRHWHHSEVQSSAC